ncbi:MAG TPA: ATP-binding protein [Arenibacter sp.]|nr:ATP-binding protein [Arenibacter sp.]
MAIKKLASSPKVYLIMLIVAMALLMFIGSISYKQIDRLGKSAESVNHIMEVGMQINKLFSYYSQMQSSEMKNRLLQDSTGISSYEIFMPETLEAYNRLKQLIGQKPGQRVTLVKVGIWQERLFQSLNEVGKVGYKSPQNYTEAEKEVISTVSTTMTQLNLLRNQIYRVEQAELVKRKEDYASQVLFTPLTTLFLGMFALFIFVVSFIQINVLRKRTARVEKFLQKVLTSSENIISYFTPIYANNGKIKDFKIDFSNENLGPLPDMAQETTSQFTISELFPASFENGIFDELTLVMAEGIGRKFEKKMEYKGKDSWFSTTATPLDNGVLTTSIDTTAEKEASKALENFNEQLRIQNSVLNDAEVVAKIGSYRWDFKTDKITMSDNLYQLLDCRSGEFEPSSQNYRAFIHPNDLKFYEDNINLTSRHKPVNKFTYRIISKKGKIKHFQHSGHFIQSEFIGVVKDITKELKDEERLKNKNLELKRSNSELESFNQVASHDLQEPLRKIQMFISMIMEGSLENISTKNIDYLNKINSSANRMQELIKNLLSYSKLNKERSEFQTVDLYGILEKVQEDLEAPIKEKKVLITIRHLPELKAVPFQMEQLFNNLISNSIKYVNSHIRPKIVIDCQKINAREIREAFHKKALYYNCISIADNGIGFDPVNSKKIFGLFQRLHQKHEYSGTGIGLAICKKIVENHKGHISAHSIVDKGTTFRIYLPA